ncbi:MAG TPA: hypothetical protein EYP98_05890, partial [Planctomycetes bacterium]|nr:hypothetical protein [Planctomycetota bacterium]
RRWLVRNPDRKFDFILMNTTFHWRSQITNLVSDEFLQLAKRHLKPGGVIYYNTTNAAAIPYTAAMVFKHVTTYGNFVAASDSPFDVDMATREANIGKFIRDAKPVFDNDNGVTMKRWMMNARLTDLGEHYRSQNTPELHIHDDNKVNEYKINES